MTHPGATRHLEMLTPERTSALWPQLEPLIAQSIAANSFSTEELTPPDVFALVQADMATMFVGYLDEKPALAMVIQFTLTNGIKGAEIIALGGANLLGFKAAYWEPVLQWLRANEIKHLDAYGHHRAASIYLRRFGFTKSCTVVRMAL